MSEREDMGMIKEGKLFESEALGMSGQNRIVCFGARKCK